MKVRPPHILPCRVSSTQFNASIENAMSYGDTLTSGIQDISALLPLLGSEQCEDHVGSALSNGFLFAAATPLSIFGTLGLAKAGFKAAFASIVIPSWDFLGAEKLRDAGFKPSGKNLELIMMDPANRDRYLLETRLCERLKDLHVQNNGELRVPDEATNWEELNRWTFRMALATAAFCIVNLTAYIELILHDENHIRRSLRLLFPITRILGSYLTVVCLQILIQRRMENIIRARELFGQMDCQFQNQGIPLEIGAIWDMKSASDKCLSRMQRALRSGVRPRLGGLPEKDCPEGLKKLMTKSANYAVMQWPFILLTLLGSFGCLVGYIGCFSIVQGYTGSLRGPLIWLVAETTLSTVRIFIWSSNSKWDNTPPLRLNRVDPPPAALFVTQREPSFEVEINGFDLKVQRADQFFQSLRYHSGIFVKPLAFPDSSLLYSLVGIKKDEHPKLFIVIVDHVDQITRVYSEENKEPKFRSAKFTVCNVEGPAVIQVGPRQPKPFGYQVRGGSAVVGELIPEEPEDHVASNEDLRTALQDHYRSILQASRAEKSVQTSYVDFDWGLTSRVVEP